MSEETFWNYEPTPCRRVRVVVGPAPSTWWCAGLEGTEREAVEVSYGDEVFYNDNDACAGGKVGIYTSAGHEAGSGWAKVTTGRGGSDWPHASLPVKEVLG